MNMSVNVSVCVCEPTEVPEGVPRPPERGRGVPAPPRGQTQHTAHVPLGEGWRRVGRRRKEERRKKNCQTKNFKKLKIEKEVRKRKE